VKVAGELAQILTEALEFNRKEARAAGESGFEEGTLSVGSGASCCGTSTAIVLCCIAKTAINWWLNPFKNKRSAIPRHCEIRDLLARKICRDLDIPPP
jgi:hypothetical protein